MAAVQGSERYYGTPVSADQATAEWNWVARSFQEVEYQNYFFSARGRGLVSN
jgi:hypothetical protein